MKKRQLLQILTERHPEISKKELYARILCGEVLINGVVEKEPAMHIAVESLVQFRKLAYVSRGGEKLEHALKSWKIPAAGKIWLDAGSSTGGFTQCLLHFDAASVHAVDVGKNRIDYTLRRDARVILHEGQNIMTLTALSPIPHMAAADLSFRSILGAAEHIIGLTSESVLLALIKPQFEIKNPEPDFTGVIHSDGTLALILKRIILELRARGLYVRAVLKSPLTGRRGNREFFFYITRRPYTNEEVRRLPSEKELLEGIL